MCKWRSSKVPLESESLRFYSDRESWRVPDIKPQL
jgi:hypothetical protein